MARASTAASVTVLGVGSTLTLLTNTTLPAGAAGRVQVSEALGGGGAGGGAGGGGGGGATA